MTQLDACQALDYIWIDVAVVNSVTMGKDLNAKHDLFEIARNNDEMLQERFVQACHAVDEDQQAHLEALVAWLNEESQVSAISQDFALHLHPTNAVVN